MRKSLFISLVLLGAISSTFAQQNTAPDQGSSASSAVSSVSNMIFGTNGDTEKEVTASEGVVYNDGKTDYASANVKFVINAKDQGSGVKQVLVLVDDSQFGIYDKAIGFQTEGKHLIGYKVEDNVGNISPFKSYEFVLDLTAPQVALVSDKKLVMLGDVIYASSNYNFGINANDALSGVKSIEYSIDDGQSATYDAPFAAVGANGLHKITYKATDNVGNATETKSYVYFMDSNPPSLDFTVEPNVYEANGVRYISSSALIKIVAKDAETAVSKIVYTIDDGKEIDYSYPIRLTSGAHTVKAKAYDLLGNISEEKSLSVTVDAINPEADLVPTK